MIFFVLFHELTLDKLLLEVLVALKFDPAVISKPTSIPFTYYHKGRGVKSTTGVKTMADFENMTQVLENKKLTAVSIILAGSDIKHLTNRTKVSVGMPSAEGLVAHTGIQNVTALSQLEHECAKISQKLKEAWPCDDHRSCYAKGDIHEHLTHFRLSSWASHIHDHMVTFTIPPKIDTFQSTFPNDKATKSKSDKSSAPAVSPRPTPTIQNANESITLALVNLLVNVVGSAHRNSAPLVTLPVTSEPIPNPWAPHLATPPLDLDNFLDYASANFAVTDQSYHATHKTESIGPDVLASLSDTKDRLDIGIPRGDAYCLKCAADMWMADPSHGHKRVCHAKSLSSEVPAAPHQTIGFTDDPPAPDPGHEPTDAEHAGQPYPGTKGNFLWEEQFPDGGTCTFWSNMPSPTLAPHDPILAPPGTVFLGVGGGEYIEVLHAPQYGIAIVDDKENIPFRFDHAM